MAGLDDQYNQLSSAGGDPSMLGAEAAAAPAEENQQLVLGAEDIKTIQDLKAKGNWKAIGEYVANLVV